MLKTGSFFFIGEVSSSGRGHGLTDSGWGVTEMEAFAEFATVRSHFIAPQTMAVEIAESIDSVDLGNESAFSDA